MNNNNNYFNDKIDENNKYFSMNKYRILSKEKNSNIKSNIKDSLNEKENESESIKGNNTQINKNSYLIGLSLVFLYFSIIIYSLLYMLVPEKTANLIFEGDPNVAILNFSLYNSNNRFYKLDSIRVRENLTLLWISRDFRFENNNKLSIGIYFDQNPKTINKVTVTNNHNSKEIDIGVKIFNNYKINDFPFSLELFKDENIMNITSEELDKLFF